MHYRFLVTCGTDRAATSLKAREYVYQWLLDGGLCTSGSWGARYADWFVIGGRWSGELSRRSWAQTITESMRAMEKDHDVQVWGCFYGPANQHKTKMQRRLATLFQKLWDHAAPPAYRGIPYQRDTYQENGYEDDAMILTQELYDALLKEYAGESESECHADLESEPVSPAMVGRKWLVVVDCHC